MEKMSRIFLKHITNSIILGIAAVFIFGTSCKRPGDIQEAILNDPGSFFYIDFSDFPEDKKPLPIGVFDSGTGGLAVLNDIVEYEHFVDGDGERVFENESFIYLADMANMPYGSYALEDNTEMLQEHIIKNVQFLLDRKYYRNPADTEYMTDKSPVKAIVIACNTATAYGQDLIEEFLEKAGMDIIVKGVIDAATTAAVSYMEPDEDGSIAVMATDGTVRSYAYVESILEKKEELGRHGDIDIFQQAAIGIAEAVDENSDFLDRRAATPREGYMGPSETKEGVLKIDMSIWDRYHFDMEDGAILYEGEPGNPHNIQLNSVENYVAFHVVSLMEQIINSEDVNPLNSIVLGCTHYPYVDDVFVDVLEKLRNYQEDGEYIYRPYMEEEIRLVNPAVKVASQLYERLGERELLFGNNYLDSEFYIAVPNHLNPNVELREDGSFTYEYKYGRTAGEIQEYVKRVPFNRGAIPDDILERLEIQTPSVYKMMVKFNRYNPKTQYLEDDFRIVPLR